MFGGRNEHRVETDVLVIGGGSAGTMAAIEAKKRGLRVSLVDKGGIYRSGCGAAGNDHFLAVLEEGPAWDQPEVFLAWYQRLTQGLADVKVAERVFVQRIKDMVADLEKMGIPMRLDQKNNTFIRTRSFMQPGDYFINFDGRALKPTISRVAAEAGVDFFPHIAITDLLKTDDRVVGAIGFQIRTGEFYVFSAQAVVLATGNVTRMYRNPSGLPYNTWHSPYNNGAAHAMTLKAGGDLKNMEFVNYTLTPKNFSASALNAIVGMGGYIVNSLGERYLFKYHEKGEQGPRWVMPWGTYWEMKEGRGPCYFDLRHLPEEAMEHLLGHLLPVDKNTFMDYCEQKGLDLRRDLMEAQICEGQLPAFLGSVSGIFVDDHCRTVVEGLYACGTCAVGIGSLSGSMCFGQAAGGDAADFVLGQGGSPAVNENQVRGFKEQVFALARCRGSLTYQEFENKLQQVMSDYVGIGRTEAGLKTAVSELSRLEGMAGELRAENGHELMRVHEALDLLLVCNAIARGALERQESRFGLSHYRGDYPETREEWRKSIHLKLVDGNLAVSYVPVDTWEAP